MIPGHVEDGLAVRRQGFHQPMKLLAERGPRLFLGSAAPEQFREAGPQRGAGRHQGDDGEQHTRFATDREDRMSVRERCPHLPDQMQVQQNARAAPDSRHF